MIPSTTWAALSDELVKIAETAQAFFLPLSTRPKEYPELSGNFKKYWHTGIVHNGKVYETMNNGKYRSSDITQRDLSGARFIPVHIDKSRLHKELRSGTSCEQFVARVTGLSDLRGNDKGELYPDDVHRLLAKTASNVFYHGSPQKLEVLSPRSEHGDPGIPEAVFGSPLRNFALTYAGRKWSDRDFNQGTRNKGQVVMREMRPNAIKDVFEGAQGYLYHLPGEGFERTGRPGSTFEQIHKGGVTPSKVEEIKNVLEAMQANPSITLLSYDPKHRETRSAIRRMVSRMKEMKNPEEYRKWRLEGAPTEIIKMFEEEAGK